MAVEQEFNESTTTTTNHTQNYDLPLWSGEDTTSWLTQMNDAMNKIDSGLVEAKSTALTVVNIANDAKKQSEETQKGLESAELIIDGYEDRMRAVESSTVELTDDITELNERAVQADTDIRALQAVNNNIIEDIGEIENQIQSFNDVTAKVNSLEEKITSVETVSNQNTLDIESAVNDISGLSTRVTALEESEVGDLSELTTRVTSLEERVTTLEGGGVGSGNVRYNEETDMVQIYHNGEWVDWKFAGLQAYYIYGDGNEFADKTGGWTTSGYSAYSGASISGTVSKLENGISLSVDEVTTDVRKYVIVGTENIIDLSNHNKLCVSYNWGGEDFVTEVDISSVSSGYVSVSLDNYNYGAGQYHYVTACIYVKNTKVNVWEGDSASTLNRKDYASNLLSMSVKKVWLE